MPATPTSIQSSREYPTGELVRRLLALAWRYRADVLLSIFLSLALLVLALLGLQLLGVVIDASGTRWTPRNGRRGIRSPGSRRRVGRLWTSSRRWPWRSWRRPCCGPS